MPLQYRGEFGLIDVSWRSLAVGAITSIIVLPVNLFIIFIFRRSKVGFLLFYFTANYNTLKPKQNSCHFADGMMKQIVLNENVSIFIKISLRYVPKVLLDNKSSSSQIMAWHYLAIT